MNPSILGSLLNKCSQERLLNLGRSIHASILKSEWGHSGVYLQNHLLNFYSKCGTMDCCHQVFDEMPVRNTVSWTTLISGYGQCGKNDVALRLFFSMVSQDPECCPNELTYASAISACAKQGYLAQGMQVQCHVLHRGFSSIVMVSNALISLYTASGDITGALLVFRENCNPDQISFNSLISGLYQNGYFQATLEMFKRMRKLDIEVTSFMLSAAIAACVESENDGRRIHSLAIKTGLNSDCFPGSALIRMYARSKSMEEAVEVFQELGSKDIASWNSLIEGYGESDQGEKGLQILSSLLKSGLKVDEITIIAVMGICTNLVMLDSGKQVHLLSIKMGLDIRIQVHNSIINMYAKCGYLEGGVNIFKQMKEKNVISWTTMIGGLAHHGRADEALQLFEEMKGEGIKPNNVTYTCILSACSHSGLIDPGRQMFNSMEVEPVEEHYVCMVHLLASRGSFEELEEFIRRAPEELQELLWQNVLVACKNLGKWDRGLEVARKIMITRSQIKPPTQVLLSSVFAGAGRWEEVERVRQWMKNKGIKKEPACSWTEIDKRFQIFRVKG